MTPRNLPLPGKQDKYKKRLYANIVGPDQCSRNPEVDKTNKK